MYRGFQAPERYRFWSDQGSSVNRARMCARFWGILAVYSIQEVGKDGESVGECSWSLEMIYSEGLNAPGGSLKIDTSPRDAHSARWDLPGAPYGDPGHPDHLWERHLRGLGGLFSSQHPSGSNNKDFNGRPQVAVPFCSKTGTADLQHSRRNAVQRNRGSEQLYSGQTVTF